MYMLALMFLSSFCMVFLLGLQSRNVNQGRYMAAVLTSAGINLANFLFVKFAADGGLLSLAIITAGGCSGVASSIWFYQNVIEKRRPLVMKESQ